MSARDEIMGLASRISAGLSSEWCGEMREHMDAYAHELAERIRNGNPDRTPDWSDGVDWAANLIDPEVSTDARS